MKKKIKIIVLLQGILLANWFLSKLLKTLKNEPIGDIQAAHNILIKVEPECVLDDLLDGTRGSLKTWNRS